MDFPQFSGSQRRNAVLHAERLQFSARVDAPRFCASLNQSRARAVVLGKEERFLENLAEHRDKGAI
jgi:hypothetical protein